MTFNTHEFETRVHDRTALGMPHDSFWDGCDPDIGEERAEEVEYVPFADGDDLDRPEPALYDEAGNELPVDNPALWKHMQHLYPEAESSRTFGKRAQ